MPTRAARLLAVPVGLALGVGVASIATREAPPQRPLAHPPSVVRLAFPGSRPLRAAAAESAAAPVVEPGSARAALDAYLAADVARDSTASYALADRGARRQHPTIEAWVQSSADRSLTQSFDILGESDEQLEASAVDFDVDIARAPALDAFRGFVAARSREIWRVSSEDGGWRVGVGPVRSRAVLPSPDGAVRTASDWVQRAAACDAPGARSFQLGDNVYGVAAFASRPCKTNGAWSTAGLIDAEETDTQSLLAAFGPNVSTWARYVEIRGPGSARFVGAFAPLGERWQLVGLLPATGSP